MVKNTIHDTLSSIISQTYQNWELIFYDNQSTDQSKKIFESFKEPRFFIIMQKLTLNYSRLEIRHWKKFLEIW